MAISDEWSYVEELLAVDAAEDAEEEMMNSSQLYEVTNPFTKAELTVTAEERAEQMDRFAEQATNDPNENLRAVAEKWHIAYFRAKPLPMTKEHKEQIAREFGYAAEEQNPPATWIDDDGPEELFSDTYPSDR